MPCPLTLRSHRRYACTRHDGACCLLYRRPPAGAVAFAFSGTSNPVYPENRRACAPSSDPARSLLLATHALAFFPPLHLALQVRIKHLSHLRRSTLARNAYPGLTPWANICRTYGASAASMSHQCVPPYAVSIRTIRSAAPTQQINAHAGRPQYTSAVGAEHT
jgi:hypothetical protein